MNSETPITMNSRKYSMKLKGRMMDGETGRKKGRANGEIF